MMIVCCHDDYAIPQQMSVALTSNELMSSSLNCRLVLAVLSEAMPLGPRV